jgi:RNA polymerase sigma-70 factor, ECF subfamily
VTLPTYFCVPLTRRNGEAGGGSAAEDGVTHDAAHMRPARLRSRRGEADEESGELVVLAKGGDKEAIERLWALHESELHVHLSRYLRDPGDVAEAAQEVFILMVKALPDYEVRETQFRFWLLRIARNHAIDVLRRESHSWAETEDHLNQLLEAAGTGSGAPGPAWLDDPRTAVAFSSLPREQQRMLLLRFGFGFKSDEVAAFLGCSPEVVRQQQSRALRRLQSTLESGDD